MRLRTRFTMIGLGITIFLILAPLLVLYARGFKYDFSTGKMVKTATLSVETDPAGTTIYLNNDSEGVDAPVNIRFLLPGNYDLKITRDGYQTWSKRLTLNSQFVTWAAANTDKVFLFYQDPKEESTTSTTANFVSPDNLEIIYNSNDRVYLLHTSNGSVDNLGDVSAIKTPAPPITTEINWNNASQIWQLLQAADHWALPTSDFNHIKKISTDGSHVAILVNSDLYTLNASEVTLVAKDVTATTIADGGIWYIQNNGLFQYSFSQKVSTVFNDALPATTNAQIIRTANQLYLILDGTLYQLTDSLQKIYGPVTFARWFDVGGGKLLYGNGNEIYLYSPIDQKSQLVIRSQTPITDAQLNWTTGYVFYQNEGKIKAAELDTRSSQNQFNILDAGLATHFVVSPDGRQLFVTYPDSVKTYTIR